MHPYYLKQYNNRWFLFGITEQDKDKLTNLPLDRIKVIEPLQVQYIPNTAFDFEEYFDDVVGVSVPRTGEPERIVLKFDEQRFPYIDTKPLHPTQTVIDRDNRIVQIEVFQTPELESLLLSHGGHVEVIEPASLREKIKANAAIMTEKYNGANWLHC